ncbi:FAD-binding protein, partial [bacterium]|nr:FAD-binding protein [bacterium]
MKVKKRKTWKNDAENQVSEPLRQYEPENLNDIISIILEAEREEVQVRAIGSGHSFSDVAITTGFQLKPNKLTNVLDLREAALKAMADTSTLLHVESGIRIRELNEELDRRGLALPNMGGYDEQTIAGVISTATHGSGIEFGPLSDIVESLELVGENGQVYRIEPNGGLTDPAAFQNSYPDRKLIQDDDWFHSVVVSMGCMGVIYSVIIRVTQKFWLKEVRELSEWATVKSLLKQGDVLKTNRHWEVLINPHKIDGKHRCLITTRNPTQKPDGLPIDKTNRNFLTEFLASLT